MWLEWEPAAMVVFILVGAVIALRPVAARWADVVGAFARELAIMFTLYAVWRLAAQLSLMQVDGAVWRGRWLWDVQRALHLPSEVSVQHLVLPHPLLVQGANVYYAVAHVPAMILFLAWLFTFHRPRYPKIRNAMALTTGACLLIQLIPVAPPRLVPGLGIVDTPLLYHQSVYGRIGTGIASQLSAMPSVHVAWALLVGFGAVMVSSSRTRWLVLAHPIVTVLVVVATGNHFWLDGIVAAALLAVALFAQRWSPIEALRQSVRTPAPAERRRDARWAPIRATSRRIRSSRPRRSPPNPRPDRPRRGRADQAPSPRRSRPGCLGFSVDPPGHVSSDRHRRRPHRPEDACMTTVPPTQPLPDVPSPEPDPAPQPAPGPQPAPEPVPGQPPSPVPPTEPLPGHPPAPPLPIPDEPEPVPPPPDPSQPSA